MTARTESDGKVTAVRGVVASEQVHEIITTGATEDFVRLAAEQFPLQSCYRADISAPQQKVVIARDRSPEQPGQIGLEGYHAVLGLKSLHSDQTVDAQWPTFDRQGTAARFPDPQRAGVGVKHGRIETFATIERVIASTADQAVVPCVRADRVIAGATVEEIRKGASRQRVIAVTSVHRATDEWVGHHLIVGVGARDSGSGAAQPGDLHIVTGGITVDRHPDRIGPLAGILSNDTSDIANEVLVVAQPTQHEGLRVLVL